MLDVCPYPTGSRMYYAWWETYHARMAKIASDEQRENARKRAYIRENKGFHKFSGPTRTCACGVSELDYHAGDVHARSIICSEYRGTRAR